MPRRAAAVPSVSTAQTVGADVIPQASRARANTSRPRRGRDELILDALERLLQQTPLRDLVVEDIAHEAGITRARFYRYFDSKDAAYAAVLRRITPEIIALYQQPGSWFERPPGTRPRDALSETFRQALAWWWKHRAVLRECSDLWNASPEVSQQWRQMIAEFTAWLAQAIERERSLGIAPDGPDAQRLASELMSSSERFLFLEGVKAADAPDQAALDTHIAVWLRTIYLTDDRDPEIQPGRQALDHDRAQ